MPAHTLMKVLHSWKQSAEDQAVVLLDTLPDKVNQFYTLPKFGILDSVNGMPIGGMLDLIRAVGTMWNAPDKEFIQFHFGKPDFSDIDAGVRKGELGAPDA